MIDNSERIAARLDPIAQRLAILNPKSWAWEFHASLYCVLYARWTGRKAPSFDNLIRANRWGHA